MKTESADQSAAAEIDHCLLVDVLCRVADHLDAVEVITSGHLKSKVDALLVRIKRSR